MYARCVDCNASLRYSANGASSFSMPARRMCAQPRLQGTVIFDVSGDQTHSGQGPCGHFKPWRSSQRCHGHALLIRGTSNGLVRTTSRNSRLQCIRGSVFAHSAVRRRIPWIRFTDSCHSGMESVATRGCNSGVAFIWTVLHSVHPALVHAAVSFTALEAHRQLNEQRRTHVHAAATYSRLALPSAATAHLA